MPRLSVKRKLAELVIDDCEFQMMVASSSAEMDEIMENAFTSLQLILGKRSYRPVTIRLKSTDWYENVFLKLPDTEFNAVVGVSKPVFYQIKSSICNDPVFASVTNKQMDLTKQLAIALWRFGHCGVAASYEEVGRRFGIGSAGTIMTVTRRVIKAMLNLERQYIFWPDKEERAKLALEMAEILPNCIGFVGGTHVNLEEAPNVETPDDYFSGKQKYGLHLQLVCDVNLRVRHMVVGRTAATHDEKVFSECSLARSPESFFTLDQWLAGDAAYKLTQHLMTPFRDNAMTGSAANRRSFNDHFSKYRVKIEQVYGKLKEKFTSLKELRVAITSKESHIYACQWIEACCVLYSILQTADDLGSYAENVNENDEGEIYTGGGTVEGEARRADLLSWFINTCDIK